MTKQLHFCGDFQGLGIPSTAENWEQGLLGNDENYAKI